jgi:Flp pilus assembly CpaF family ATPase
MKIWYNNVIDTDRRVYEVVGNRVRIGRAESNEIVLPSPFVAEEAAVLYRKNGRWELVVNGLNGLKLGDERLANGDRREIRTQNTISLFPWSLTIELPQQQTSAAEALRAQLDQRMSALIRVMHIALLEREELKLDSAALRQDNDEYLLTLERTLDHIAAAQSEFADDKSGLMGHIAGHAVRDQLLTSLCELDAHAQNAQRGPRHWSQLRTAVPEREQELSATAAYLLAELAGTDASDVSSRITAVETGFWKAWNGLSPNIHRAFRKYLATRHLKKEIKDIVFGYGPLEDLLRLPTVSEIMVVDREHIYIERNGRLENSGRRFVSDAVIESIIQRIVAQVGRRIDKSQPLVDARLSDGSRVNAVIPPLAVSGPCLTIRMFPHRKLTIDELVEKGALTSTAAEFLRAVVLARRNILISGGTGTGKTTLLNCLSDFIPDDERIVTVEDTAELQLAKQHVVRLETKRANVEGAGEYTIRDLVRNALRMRPDRIVVGECRGPEALDMLQAMNTGHDGSQTTIHANDTRDVILRLEVLVQMAADLPVQSIRQQIAAAVDIVVQLKRMRNGRRCVSQITEVAGINPHNGAVEMRDLYLLEDPEDVTATLEPTGRLPTFIGDLVSAGILDVNSFYR